MNVDSPILTIAIPTFNRAAKLQIQLERLCPQLTAEVRLCVHDNASPDETHATVAKFPGIQYFRAVTNCGASRNSFRCFEECTTEWLWVVSDDDPVADNAVAELLSVLRQETADFVHANFSEAPYERDVMASDLPTLFQHTDLSNLLWLTGGIYRMSSFRPLFRIYNEGMSTWGPHLLTVLIMLEMRGGKVHLSPLKLTLPGMAMANWSTVEFLLRFSQVPEYLKRPEHQRLVAENIFRTFYHNFMLWGLRETATDDLVRRWQRLGFQTRANFKAYGARGVIRHVLRNWYRAGRRKSSWRLLSQAIQIQLLCRCPVRLFHPLVRWLPLEKDVRARHYDKRHEYKPYL